MEGSPRRPPLGCDVYDVMYYANLRKVSVPLTVKFLYGRISSKTSVVLSITITGMHPATTALPNRIPHPPPLPEAARQNCEVAKISE
eukprot:703497-Prorocentrum_minimum.AAC.1